MPTFLPTGTTWLDVATLLIALAALGLTIRRDPALGKLGVSIAVRVVGTDFVVGLTNTERRTVSIERAGVSSARSPDGFMDWNRINVRSGGHMVISDPPLSKTLEPGTATYELRAPLSRVKGVLFPKQAAWAWCTDSYGTTRWQAVASGTAAAVQAVRRVVDGGSDSYGQPMTVEIDDDEDRAGRRLA